MARESVNDMARNVPRPFGKATRPAGAGRGSKAGFSANGTEGKGTVSRVRDRGPYCLMRIVETIKGTLSGLCADVMSVVAPPVCPVCGAVLIPGEECLCAGCLARLEYTGYENVAENPMEQRLERLTGNAVPAMALLVYTHGEVSGRMVSAFKYGGQRTLAVYAGSLLGAALAQGGRFGGYDALVPVPLHPRRLRRRGYNQAAELCRGMASFCSLGTQDLLVRTAATREQASLGRRERLGNVRNVFALREGAAVQGGRFILVDDVFTTGATMSAAAGALYRAGARQVAVACLCAG